MIPKQGDLQGFAIDSRVRDTAVRELYTSTMRISSSTLIMLPPRTDRDVELDESAMTASLETGVGMVDGW